MSVNRGISGSTGEIFIISIGNMCLIIFHHKFFGQPEVNHIYFILVGPPANEKIIRFNIPMQNSPLMDKLDELQHLQSNHDSGFKWKFAIASIQHILERLTQIVHDHHIIVSLPPDIVHLRNINFFTYFLSFDEFSDKFWLVKQLRTLR